MNPRIRPTAAFYTPTMGFKPKQANASFKTIGEVTFGKQSTKPATVPAQLVSAANVLNQNNHFNEYDGLGKRTKEVKLDAQKSFDGISPELWHHLYPHDIQTEVTMRPLNLALDKGVLGVLEEVSDLQYELIGLIAHKRGLIPQKLIDHTHKLLAENPQKSVLDLLPQLTNHIQVDKTLNNNAKALSNLVYDNAQFDNLDTTRKRMALTAIRYSQLGYATQGNIKHVPEKDLIQQLHGELAEMVSNIPLFDKSEFSKLLQNKKLEIQQHPRLQALDLKPNPELSHHLRTVLGHIDRHQAEPIAHHFQATQRQLIGILKQTLGLQKLSQKDMLQLMDDYYLRKHLLRQEFNIVLPQLDRPTRKTMTKLFEAMSEAELVGGAWAKAAIYSSVNPKNSQVQGPQTKLALQTA